jgi:hypothetical protein
VKEKKENIIERIRRESKGFNLLDPEREELERQDNIRVWIAISKKRNREITDVEMRSINI